MGILRLKKEVHPMLFTSSLISACIPIISRVSGWMNLPRLMDG